MTKGYVYDVVHFFGLKEIQLEKEVVARFVGDFIAMLGKNKHRTATLAVIKEQAKSNSSFKLYGIQSEMAKGGNIKAVGVLYNSGTIVRFYLLALAISIVTLN